MLRHLANALLALLVLDGTLTLLDALARAASGSTVFEGLRGGVGFVLGVCVFAAFTGLHFTPRLRIGLFLPPCLLVSWVQLGAMPLPLWLGFTGAKAACGALEIAAGVWLARRAMARTGRWMFDDSCFPGENVSSRRVTGFAAFVLLVMIPGTLLYGYASTRALVSEFTGGYLRFDTTGLYAKDQTYANAGQRIRLIATVHVAVPSFYREVFESIPEESLTLAEGVSDREGLLPGFGYGGPARMLGLTEQSDAWGRWSESHAVRAADVDVSDLSEPTIRLLQGLSRAMNKLGEGDAVGALRVYSSLAELDVDPAHVIDDVLERRNAHVLGEIEVALRDSDLLIVPWGAAHMKGLHEGVIAMGFEPVESIERRVLAW